MPQRGRAAPPIVDSLSETCELEFHTGIESKEGVVTVLFVAVAVLEHCSVPVSHQMSAFADKFVC